ncbi:putative transporter SVOPL [Trichoplusia ni]|uniref:Transporter SVOPL n=1 Tax=Trichoplusia ni TaxID=7111 RepID=A0A7E5WY82_TRINI|nr:putative transporter SVOPL [Trichoplusia ni]
MDLEAQPSNNCEPVTPMQEINRAYETFKFGWFHVKLLIVTFFGCVASIQVTNSTAFLLPIAECDLNMNLKQKGLLTAMPFFGMFISTIITGFLIDTFGRIIFLRIGFAGIFFFTLLSASSQTYEMLAASKLCEGIL